MSIPAAGWRGEPGGPCGHTWATPIVVSGTLPNGWGQDLKVTLAPVVPEIPATDFGVGVPAATLEGLGVGHGGPVEQTIRDVMGERIEQLEGQAMTAPITTAQRGMVMDALARAALNLQAADEIHRRWLERRGGAWGLHYGDTEQDFPIVDCEGKHGQYVDAPGRLGKLRCPSPQETAGRPRDRAAIHQRFIDAAHWIRCAEYGLNRMILYARAKRQYEEQPVPGPGGLQTPTEPDAPDGPFVGIPVPGPVFPPPGLKVPPQPPDVPIPPVQPLPPLPIPPDAGPAPDLPGPPAAPAPVRPSPAKAALGVAGIVALGWWAKSAGVFR